MTALLLWCWEGHGSPRTLCSWGGQDSWTRSVLRIMTWCWAPSSTLFSSGLLCREVRVMWEGAEESTWGHSDRQAMCSKCLLQEVLGSWYQQKTGSTHLFLSCPHSWILFTAPASLCPSAGEDALHLAQLGLSSSIGQLGETWPVSALGLPIPWIPARCSPLAKLPLRHLSPNQEGQEARNPMGALGPTGREASHFRRTSGHLGKASPGLWVWPPGLQPFLFCFMLVCWCGKEWWAGLCVCRSCKTLSHL